MRPVEDEKNIQDRAYFLAIMRRRLGVNPVGNDGTTDEFDKENYYQAEDEYYRQKLINGFSETNLPSVRV